MLDDEEIWRIQTVFPLIILISFVYEDRMAKGLALQSEDAAAAKGHILIRGGRHLLLRTKLEHGSYTNKGRKENTIEAAAAGLL